MKKSRRKARTGNPAAEARKPPGPPPKDKWLGREMEAFFGLPEWFGMLVLILAGGAALAVWRWLAG